MSNPVAGVSRVGKTERDRKNASEFLKRNPSHHHREDGDDVVDISEEARDKVSGKSKKSILDYINE